MYRVFWILLYVLPMLVSAQGIPPIGQWREHLPWNSATNLVIDGDQVVCSTPYALFYYDQKQASFQRWTRMNGLSETGINAIGYDPSTKSSIIVYKNSNIDVIKGDKVINIPDIRITNVPGNKIVNRLIVQSGRAYLATGLGIIVVDLSRYLILDTWRIGSGGKEIKVNDVLFTSTHRFAATEEGVKAAPLAVDAADHRNWLTMGNGSVDELAANTNAVYARKGDSLFRVNNGLLYLNKINGITGMDIIDGSLVVLSPGKLTTLNADGSIAKTITLKGLNYPVQVSAQGTILWIADLTIGLCKWNGSTLESILPNGPNGIATGAMAFAGKELWATSGSVDVSWNGENNNKGIYHLKEDQQWETIDRTNNTKLDSLSDFISVAAGSGSVFFGAFRGGVAEWKNNKDWFVYRQNSTLQVPYKVSGMAMDESGNVWVANYGAINPLHVYKKDGSWKSFRIPYTLSDNAVAGISIDQLDQKWIIAPKGNGLIVLNSGSSVDNPNDDQWRYYRFGKGQGNLPSNNVNCAVVDRNGFIWVGTDKGIGVITCADKATSSTCDALWPIIQQNGFAGYLFQSEDVRAIAVDGANRKWVGTKNGLWLINAEGEKIIHQFTSLNSPLLANEIYSLTIDPSSGEVFVATANGICSFRATATEPVQNMKEVLVFPNPVPPGFAGTIGIRGLPENAIVKITELDGRLVHQTRSLGGQAIWNGKNSKGEKVNSGVYLVLVADEQNVFKLVTKIFFVR